MDGQASSAAKSVERPHGHTFIYTIMIIVCMYDTVVDRLPNIGIDICRGGFCGDTLL